jgi:hypothetical protein
MQAAGLDDLDVVLLGDGPRLVKGGVVGRFVDLPLGQTASAQGLRREAGRVATEQDVGAAARHVRRDRDCAGPAGLGNDARFLLVELRVQRLVLDAASLEHRGEDLDFSTLTVPTRTGRPISCMSTISSISALNFAFSSRKTRSASSVRTMSRWVGMPTTSRL